MVVAVDEDGRPINFATGIDKEEAVKKLNSSGVLQTAKFFIVIDSIAAGARAINIHSATGRSLIFILKEVVPQTFTVEVLRAGVNVGKGLSPLFLRFLGPLFMSGAIGLEGPENERDREWRLEHGPAARRSRQDAEKLHKKGVYMIGVPSKKKRNWFFQEIDVKDYNETDLEKFLEKEGIPLYDDHGEKIPHVTVQNPKLKPGEFQIRRKY